PLLFRCGSSWSAENIGPRRISILRPRPSIFPNFPAEGIGRTNAWGTLMGTADGPPNRGGDGPHACELQANPSLPRVAGVPALGRRRRVEALNSASADSGRAPESDQGLGSFSFPVRPRPRW